MNAEVIRNAILLINMIFNMPWSHFIGLEEKAECQRAETGEATGKFHKQIFLHVAGGFGETAFLLF